MSKISDICKEKVGPVVEEMGYEIVEIEYSKKQDGNNLTFVIDNDKGILIEDCEKVHKVIDKLLDEINPTNDEPYILNISSPGIDRPIKTERDFLRHIGKEIEIKTFAPIDNNKSFVGKLVEYTPKIIIIEQNGTTINIDRTKIAHIVPVIKF